MLTEQGPILSRLNDMSNQCFFDTSMHRIWRDVWLASDIEDKGDEYYE